MSVPACPEVIAGPIAAAGPLVRDYTAGVDLSRFYTGHPGDVDAYSRKAAEVDERLDAAARGRVADAIVPLGDAAGRLQQILAGDGFFVTTGQQPALFGGPLYTPYKILAAIRLANVLERRLERPVLALFWVGSDDHDWDEANNATVLDAAGYPRRISVAAAADAPPLPLSDRVWGPDIDRAVRDVLELLPESSHSEAVRQHVREAYTRRATVAQSFTATIRHLFGDRRLALVDSADPAVRRASAPVLRREAEHAAAHIAVVSSQTERLTAAGYRAPVTITREASNLMLLDGSGRDRLVLTRGGWTTRRSRRVLSAPELLRRIDEEPQSFSPNVLLRPVVESALFPTIAYVAGPGEISYFAQIGCLFNAHGILPPVVVPRPGVTLLEPRIAKLLQRLGLAPAEVQVPFDDVATRLIRGTLPPSVAAALDALREDLRAGYDRLTDAATALDPTLRGSLIAARNAGLLRTNRVERKIIAHAKLREDVLMGQLRRAAASLYPDGKPQERALNMLYYSARYGPGLTAAIEDALDMELRAVGAWAGPLCE